MHKKTGKRVIFFLLLLVAVAVSACGTVEIEPVPAAASERPGDETVEMLTPVTSVEEATPAEDVESVPVEEVTLATPSTVVSASGADVENVEQVSLPGCYDFDTGITLAPPDPACDLNLLPGPDSGTIEVYPIGAAQLAYGAVFPEAPTLAQCAENGAFSPERELVAPLAARYICYRTGEGRLGYLHFTDADLEQAYTVSFAWLTFAQDDDGVPGVREDLVYLNDAFGFRLALPETWTGYETSQTEHDGVTSICFTFVGSAPFCVLQIDVYEKDTWENLENVPEGYYVAENDEFVFAAGPYQAECVQLDDFQCARHQEVPSILDRIVVE